MFTFPFNRTCRKKKKKKITSNKNTLPLQLKLKKVVHCDFKALKSAMKRKRGHLSFESFNYKPYKCSLIDSLLHRVFSLCSNMEKSL